MKPPSQNEVPPRIWNYLNRYVPESMRGTAAVELMKLVQTVDNSRLRVAMESSARSMMLRMRYNKWRCYAVGFLIGTVIQILIHL